MTNVAARRAALIAELGVVGGSPSERFDRITRLARDLFHAPMAYLNLVDSETVHILTPTSMQWTSLPAKDSFCSQTVEQDEPLLLSDTRNDPRYADLPAVRDFGIRFYAGAPVTVRGIRIGSVCVMDTRPRTLSDSDLIVLRDLATWAGRILSGLTPVFVGEASDADLKPGAIGLVGYELSADSIPFEDISGDFYDWAATDTRLTMTLGDVMGKGAAAGALATALRSAFHEHEADTTRDPADRADGSMHSGSTDLLQTVAALNAVEKRVGPELMRAEAFATIFHATLDRISGRVTFADAGHGIAFHLPARGPVRILLSRDLPIGLHLTRTPRTGDTFHLLPGDALIVCSDGVLDLFDGTLRALEEIAALHRAFPDPRVFFAELRGLATRGRATDDITTVLLTRNP